MNRPKPHRRVVVMSLAVVVSLHLGVADTPVWAQQDALPDTVLAATASPSYPQLVPASDSSPVAILRWPSVGSRSDSP